jgi:hypothetical protein
LKFTNLFLKYEKYKKLIIRVTDKGWRVTLKLLLGLSGDPYDYQKITDNPWSFKIRNKGK